MGTDHINACPREKLTVNKNPLERDIERKVCDYAKSLGMLCYKFTSPSRRSVPDRMFITKAGVVFFIEFKRRGQEPTLAQAVECKKLRDQGVRVFIVDTVDYGKLVISDEHSKSAAREKTDPQYDLSDY